MNEIDDGGPAFPCSRCGVTAVRKQGHQWLCARHYRIGQMRAHAKRDGKFVPTHEQIEALLGDTCQDCGVVINLLSRQGEQHKTVSLQHYRDGTLGIVCRSCNTRHAFMPGDSYRDMPKNHKRCPRCEQIKPASEFTLDNGRSGVLRRKSKCRACSDAATTEWREKNRDQYNAHQREYRAKRKAEGSPVNGKT